MDPDRSDQRHSGRYAGLGGEDSGAIAEVPRKLPRREARVGEVADMIAGGADEQTARAEAKRLLRAGKG